jgi:hypothetical protein
MLKHNLKYKILVLLLHVMWLTSTAQNDEDIYKEQPVEVYGDSKIDQVYEPREFSDTRMSELKSQKDFQYDDDKIQKDNEQNKNGSSDYDYSKKDRKERLKSSSSSSYSSGSSSGGASSWWIILLLFLIVAGIILYSIGFKPSSLFRKDTKNMAENNADSTFDEDHIDNIKFESELDKAIRLGNYRLAVRILYLESLKILNDKKMIDWKINKTNWDYVKELNQPQLKGDFKQITNSFDYVWYGNFAIDESTFKLMQEKMINFKKKI